MRPTIIAFTFFLTFELTKVFSVGFFIPSEHTLTVLGSSPRFLHQHGNLETHLVTFFSGVCKLIHKFILSHAFVLLMVPHHVCFISTLLHLCLSCFLRAISISAIALSPPALECFFELILSLILDFFRVRTSPEETAECLFDSVHVMFEPPHAVLLSWVNSNLFLFFNCCGYSNVGLKGDDSKCSEHCQKGVLGM